jgi:hypothetical protein
MTEARPTLEYRAAADDRRQSLGQVLRFLPKTVLVIGVILFAYLFLLCVLGAILLGVASLVSLDPRLGLAAGASAGFAMLCFVLMMGCARVMK